MPPQNKGVSASEIITREFKQSMDAIGAGVVCVDFENHKILYVNPSFEEISLYTQKILDHLKFEDLFVPTDKDRVSDFFTLNSKNNEIIKDNEFLLKRKSGRICNVSLSYNKLSGTQLILVTVTDNTPRKELENELKDIYAQMIQTSKFVSLAEMAAGIAHEINNPLSIIHGIADQIELLSKMDRLTNEKLYKSTKTLKDTTMRASRIIDSLKALSRNDKNDPKHTENLNSIINNALELCSKKIKYQNINILVENNFEEALILCNPSQILQVLLNLFENSSYAVKNLKNSWIKISVDKVDDRIVLKFIDSGPGIKNEHIEKIMNPFFTTKNLGEGTGLGLSLSKNIIHKHDGKLILLSNTINTTFEIILPYCKKTVVSPVNNINDDEIDFQFSMNYKGVAETPLIPIDKVFDPSKFTILTIDDEPDILDVTTFQLNHFGYKTLTASNGSEALKLIEVNKIDLILTDVKMPTMCGIEFLEKIKLSKHKDIKVIYITGSVNYSIESFYNMGADAIFNKPINYKGLLNRITQILKESQSPWKRSNQRVICKSAIQLLYSKKAKPDSRLVNIGRGGMFILLNDQLPEVNDYITFKLNIENDENELQVVDGIGRVCWVREQTHASKPKGIGVEFFSVNDPNNSLTELINYINTRSYIPNSISQSA